MGMSASSMKSKIESAIGTSGPQVSEGIFNVLLGLCQGIIEEIQQNAQVNPGIVINVPSTSAPGNPSIGASTSPGTIS